MPSCSPKWKRLRHDFWHSGDPLHFGDFRVLPVRCSRGGLDPDRDRTHRPISIGQVACFVGPFRPAVCADHRQLYGGDPLGVGDDQPKFPLGYWTSIGIALLAWVGHTELFVFLILFPAILAGDWVAHQRQVAPAWYWRLRVYLTAVVVCSLAALWL